MNFSSLDFLLFFTGFFLVYWFICNRRLIWQNGFLLISSYAFYAWGDWRFLPLLIGASLFNYLLGIFIEETGNARRRKLLLLLGIVQGIGLLFFFKYYNFFIGSFNKAFAALNMGINLQSLSFIIPLGISFFTFRMVSYLLDIDKGKIKACRNWVSFFAYVAFFPSLLAGPIDKARTFLPQLEKLRIFNYDQASDGMRQILWGLFKKLVIADNCAFITNYIFDNYTDVPASSLVLGAFFYTIQVYADFSGYSDIAIGVSKLLGFSIMKNFDYPFFSQNIADFWRKWHISLTAWLTEYVFTPLTIAFRDRNKTGLILAIIINFILVGMWHGANWTFILFGLLHGIYYIPLILKGNFNKKTKMAKGKLFPSFREIFNMASLFILLMFTFIIFRSDNIGQAFSYYQLLGSKSLLRFPTTNDGITLGVTLFFILIMFIIEWLYREKDYGLQIGNIKKPWLRIGIYYLLLLVIFVFRANEANQFIYFQF